MAASRFHRDSGPDSTTAGIGLNELEQAHLRSMRMLTHEVSVFSGEPRNDLLSSRDEDQAYAMAEPGRWVAVYFPDGGVVVLRLGETPGFLTMRWLNILTGEWSSPTRVSGGGILALGPPAGAEGPWAAVLTVESVAASATFAAGSTPSTGMPRSTKTRSSILSPRSQRTAQGFRPSPKPRLAASR